MRTPLILLQINDYQYLTQTSSSVSGSATSPPSSAEEAKEITPPAKKFKKQKKQKKAKKQYKPADAQAVIEPELSDAPEFKPAPSHSFGHSIVSREEKVEYRDQDGNILNEEQVKALEGKVSFKTRYETRTRLVDGSGDEVEGEIVGEAADAGVAPPHPDVDNVDPETPKAPVAADAEVPAAPASEPNVKEDIKKEGVVEKAAEAPAQAEPASEANEATDSAEPVEPVVEAKEEKVDWAAKIKAAAAAAKASAQEPIAEPVEEAVPAVKVNEAAA